MIALDCLINYRERINAFLAKSLIAMDAVPAELRDAIQYVVLGGGKRIRAGMVYATGEALGAELIILDKAAAAVELVHAYSLVHDDLPAMDDDELRHGKAACHKVFGEAIAILAGDALQAFAFEMLAKASENISAEINIKMIGILAKASGARGMVGGQVLDLIAEGKQITPDQLENIHLCKTGALITASVQLGALAGGCVTEIQFINLTKFAQTIGLAFQVRDDIIDIESNTAILGKKQGADLTKNKATYPALLGMSAAKDKLKALYQQAYLALEKAGLQESKLKEIAQFVIGREF